MTAKIFLKQGKEKPLSLRHPWIFSGAIDRVENALDGDTADILAAEGDFLARGYYNSRSQITARVWTLQADEPIDRTFFERRIQHAKQVREQLGLNWRAGGGTNAFRFVNAESDFLPGLVVDCYNDFLIVQFLTLGVERRKSEIIETLDDLLRPRGIYERSDVDIRAKEGLDDSVGVLRGDEPPDQMEIVENGLPFRVDVKRGHKTGFYLDQRDSRQSVAAVLARLNGGEILNAFSYTGAFGVSVCAANSRVWVLNLDASAEALELARENFARNGFETRADFITGDAFQVLRKFRDAARQFDAIILDPPKFVYSKGQLESGCRGYKDLNLLAFKLLRPGGYLITFSCSGLVSAALFQKVVFEAATDAQRDAQILARLGPARDHPTLLAFPEGEYLKGLVMRVV